MTIDAPIPSDPAKDWEHFELFERVKTALYALPTYFHSEINVVGIRATDIQTLNTAFGAAIEDQVVQSLNNIRQVWDPKQNYEEYAFVRQSQTFPDVLLRKTSDNSIIMGVELKGWYLLAKEREPSFRFTVNPDACMVQDLIAIYPWALSQVVSGSPKLFPPYVVSAKYVAQYRNYHWEHIMTGSITDRTIELATAASPYPSKSAAITDRPVLDRGGNFGRLARTGIMDDFIGQAEREIIAGIEARYWREFFKIFTDKATAAAVELALLSLGTRIATDTSQSNEDLTAEIRRKLVEIANILLS